MQKYLKNYEKRMKDFVLKMAEKPIILRKNRDKYTTSRQEFFALTSNKILDKKGFQFKSYKSDKERINEFLKGKASLDKYLEEVSKTKKRKEKLKIKRNEPKLIQPFMRFTARTGLERVYDILKNRENLYHEEKIIKNQLAKMGFYSQYIDDEDDETEEGEEKENKNSNDKSENNEDSSDEAKYKKELHNKIIQERKNMINKRKFLLDVDKSKKIDNSKAKYLRGELYQRTHFKTLENLTMFKTSTINHNIFKKWKIEDEEKQQNIKIKNINNYNNILFNGTSISYYHTINNNSRNKISLKKSPIEFKKISSFDNIPKNEIKNVTKNNDFYNYYNNIKTFNNTRNKEENNFKKSLSSNQQFNLIGNKNLLEELEITKEIANSNPLLFNLNFNNAKNEYNNSIWNKDQFNILKKMAFEKNPINNDFFPSEPYIKNEYDDLKKEEYIIIDGKEYKKSETYKIADKILKKKKKMKKMKKKKKKKKKKKLIVIKVQKVLLIA